MHRRLFVVLSLSFGALAGVAFSGASVLGPPLVYDSTLDPALVQPAAQGRDGLRVDVATSHVRTV